LGDVTKSNLARGSSATAAIIASVSRLKSARRERDNTRAPLTAASKGYMPKVGGQLRTASPGSTNRRITRSISSSAPWPASRYLAGTPA
jgi:hypothetical protein